MSLVPKYREALNHVRHCVECYEVGMENCPTGEPLLSAIEQEEDEYAQARLAQAVKQIAFYPPARLRIKDA